MFGAFVVMAAMAFFFAGVMAIQLVYVLLLKLFNPKASWKKCFRKAGW